ncbi:rhodopsin-like [Condylostylus longicornis]|uniref:rhodopsin-like n=1 Tax=Condylostylus longicornis TaxID=2530218 RepID=UPI00244DFE66|nr:rhodopsin-like [Condylostylus longicornis]
MEKIIEPYFAAQRSGNLSVVDTVPADMLYLVDNYWNQFPPMNPLWHGILGFFMTIFGIISLTGNFIVIIIFTSEKSLRTPSNMFVISLAVSDFMMMLTMFPAMVYNCYYETWVLGPLMCEIYGMCGSLFGCISIWSMTMIAFDRYNVIVKGITGKRLTVGRAVFYVALVWIVSTIWTLLPLFGWNRYVPEGNMTACGTDYLTQTWLSRSYIVVYGSWVYFTPLFSIIFSYYFIIKAVAEHERTMREQAKKMNVASLRSTENESKSIEAKLAKIALVTISLWFFAWTPYLIINFSGIFQTAKLTPLATIWGSVFAKCNAMYNPIVYGISHPKYREALYKKFPILDCAGSDQGKDIVSEKTEATVLQTTTT